MNTVVTDSIVVTVRVEVNGDVHEVVRTSQPESTHPAVLPLLADMLLIETSHAASAWLDGRQAVAHAAAMQADRPAS